MTPRNFKILLLAVAVILSTSSIYFSFHSEAISLKDISSPIWKSNLLDKFYVISADWIETHPPFQELLNQSKSESYSKSDLKEYIASQFRGSGSDVLKKIEQDVREEYTEDMIEVLRGQIHEKVIKEATEEKFFANLKSFKIAEELKAVYLKNNELLLKNQIVKDFLKDTSDETLKSQIENLDSLDVSRGKYFHNILEHALLEFAPSDQNRLVPGKTVPSNGLKEVTVPPKSRKFLTDRRVRVAPEVFKDLQEKHDGFVTFLRSMTTPPIEIYSGSGIVLSAGKKHIIGALNVIIQIRETGSELPIELMLDMKSDYNERLCETVLPQFGAKCLVIENILDPEIYDKFKHEGFPMKVVALMLSSFDDTIYMDSDNFPIKNVDMLIESEPYLKTKFLLWPDNWHKGVSPIFYDIVRLNAGEPVRRDGLSNEDTFASYISRDRDSGILLHDLDGIPPFTSVESGQLVFSKREHFRSLFLALYYNLHGERYYYRLLFQGVFGAGDRETFVPALHVMNEPYYLTEWDMKFSGVQRERPNKPGEMFYDESTMIQGDPDEATRFRTSWRLWLTKQGLDSRLDPFQNGDFTQNLLIRFFEENSEVKRPGSFFLHVHSPKINSVYNEQSSKSRYNYQERYIRKLDAEDKESRLGSTDWELKFQAINTWSTCKGMTGGKFWSSFELDQKELCRRLEAYIEILKQDSNDLGAAELKFLKEESQQ